MDGNGSDFDFIPFGVLHIMMESKKKLDSILDIINFQTIVSCKSNGS